MTELDARTKSKIDATSDAVGQGKPGPARGTTTSDKTPSMDVSDASRDANSSASSTQADGKASPATSQNTATTLHVTTDKPKRKPLPISFNAPVILGFTALSLIALLLGLATGGATTRVLFSTYRASMADPLTFVRMFTYVLGHADFEHWLGNITILLIVGPMIEEKYGSLRTFLLILVTAFVTALFNSLLFNTALLGASGVVFAMILLSSFASYEKGSIPLTLIFVAVIFIGGQIVAALQPDSISQFAHIFGGLIGCAAGFAMNRKPKGKGKKK